MQFLQHDALVTELPGEPQTCKEECNPALGKHGVLRRIDKKPEVGDWKSLVCDLERSSSGSPEVCGSPRSLVPAACFPPVNTNTYSSLTGRARPASLWGEDLFRGSADSATMAALSNSFGSLAIPNDSSSANAYTRVGAYTEKSVAMSQYNLAEPVINRRASFCGGIQSPRQDKIAYWQGELPQGRVDTSSGYSSKVFLGGLPWDITESALRNTFKNFHPLKVEWPTTRGVVDASTVGSHPAAGPRGYAYITFESERNVRSLLEASRFENEEWYYTVATRKTKKKVQIIPWCVSNSTWVNDAGARLEPRLTVFVGALHGVITAEALAMIMNAVFGGVVYAGIDMDRNKYPIGSGRVTFNNFRSFIRAVSAEFLCIHTNKFSKKVQLDPYLEDSACSVCAVKQGPYFCREPTCFKYYCRVCWFAAHINVKHRPLTRAAKVVTHQRVHNANTPLANEPRTSNPANRFSGSDFQTGLFSRNNDTWGPV